MRLVLYNIFITLTILVFIGCRPMKTNFTVAELRWLDIYNVGDTLIYKSSNGRFDTSYIIGKKIYYPEYIPIEVHNKYLPHTGVVTYKNRNLVYRPDGEKLIYMYKAYPDKQTRLMIDYLNSSVTILDLTTGSIEKYKKGNTYEFNAYHRNGKPGEPNRIFWHEKLGIIKYITNDSTIWERINISR
ncbi:hypothetical protein [Chitinophaga cymbidii]|nr:hypothetical protein [Chitinophaga cymbidii]